MSTHDLLAHLETPADFADEGPDGKTEWWILGPFGDGHRWLGRYRGTGPWTRHPDCDAVMHTLQGTVDVEVLDGGATAREALPAGSVRHIPRGTWYRVHAEEPVVQWGVTPGAIVHHEGEGLPAH